MKIIKLVNKLLNKFNAQILRYPSVDISRRINLFNYLKINVLLDVGANVGNYSLEMIAIGYQGRIVSFEPLRNAFLKLEHNSNSNENWKVYNIALGDFDGYSTINISKNSDSSSMLAMLPKHLETAPQSEYISKEGIEVKRLDTIYNEICSKGDNVFLKIDTQGFEKKVLDGAMNSLKLIKAVQIEMSIIPLYEGSLIYKDIIALLESFDFRLVSIENGFFNSKTGELLQFDGIFIKV